MNDKEKIVHDDFSDSEKEAPKKRMRGILIQPGQGRQFVVDSSGDAEERTERDPFADVHNPTLKPN